MTIDLRIAIIGAGPAGCLLARILHLASISVVLFEGEAALEYRSQGGTLDLHTDTGQAALKKAKLYDEFLKHARFDGEAFKILDKKLTKYVNMGGATEKSTKGRPEIDRPVLRRFLVESLPRDCIRWGKRLQRIDDDLNLYFDDSTEGGFDLVIGADGAWSKVRPLLTSVIPHYSGIGGIQGSIPDAASTVPELHKLCNRGSAFAISDNTFIGAQQMGDESLSVSIWRMEAEARLSMVSAGDASSLKSQIRKDYAAWDQMLIDSFLKCDNDSMSQRPLYMLPVDLRWEHRHGVTIIGDAAHLMTPFAGEGVNVAFTDAMMLADVIIKAVSNSVSANERRALLDRQVAKFEEEMFVRMNRVQRQTETMMHACLFTSAFPRHGIESYLLAAVTPDVPRILVPVVTAVVYIYFFYFRILH